MSTGKISDNNQQPASATLAVATGCVHCASMLEALSRLIKSGQLARLNVINITHDPEFARDHQIHSVPWLEIHNLIFTGEMKPAETQHWVEVAAQNNALETYLAHLLDNGEVNTAIEMVKKSDPNLSALLKIMANPDASLNARIGIGVIVEGLQGATQLINAMPELTRLCAHENPSIRADAAYYLGLSEDSRAIDALDQLLNDENSDVREVAADAIELLRNPEKREPDHSLDR